MSAHVCSCCPPGSLAPEQNLPREADLVLKLGRVITAFLVAHDYQNSAFTFRGQEDTLRNVCVLCCPAHGRASADARGGSQVLQLDLEPTACSVPARPSGRVWPLPHPDLPTRWQEMAGVTTKTPGGEGMGVRAGCGTVLIKTSEFPLNFLSQSCEHSTPAVFTTV